MLNHPTLAQLEELGLTGMAKALRELLSSGDAAGLSLTEGLGLLLDRETSERRDKRLKSRLKYANLRHQAVVEDVDYKHPRKLDRAVFQKLIAGDWIGAHDNLIICGKTGLGKSWLACALGHKACRDNRSVLYQRAPKLFGDLALARGDGRHARLLKTLSRVDVLILDDFGLGPLDAPARQDLLEIVEERYGRRSTIITSQPPVEKWHDAHRRAHLRRRHPRPHRPQRPPHRTRRRDHPQKPRAGRKEGVRPMAPPRRRMPRPIQHRPVLAALKAKPCRAARARRP